MANIYTDKHRSHVGHRIRELHPVKITSHLAVDLAKDVASLSQVELHGVAHCDHLRRDLVHRADFLDHWVVGLSIEEADSDFRVSECCVRAFLHVVQKLLLKLWSITFFLKLDHDRILDSDL